MNNTNPDKAGKESLKDDLIAALHQSVIETQKVTEEIQTGNEDETLPEKKPGNTENIPGS